MRDAGVFPFHPRQRAAVCGWQKSFCGGGLGNREQHRCCQLSIYAKNGIGFETPLSHFHPNALTSTDGSNQHDITIQRP